MKTKITYILAGVLSLLMAMMAVIPAQALTYADILNQARVLGASSYPSVTVTSAGYTAVVITATPLEFANGAWKYSMAWKRQLNRDGSLMVNGQMVASDAPQSGTVVVENLPPSSRIRVNFYSQINGGGRVLVGKSFTTIAAPVADNSGNSAAPNNLLAHSHSQNPVTGDLNGDGLFNCEDVSYIQNQYLAGKASSGDVSVELRLAMDAGLPCGTLTQAPVITSLAPSSGSTKTQVTISGSGFTPDGNILNFGSNRFNSSFVNSSTLVFYAPDSVSGQYPVSVTNSNGTSNTLNFNFSSAGSSLSPTVTLVPDGPYVVPGGYTRLTWYATNASSCTAGGGWNDNAVLPGLSGRITVGPINSTTTFTITCTGAGPDVQASATVSVANGDRPTYSVTSPSGGEQWAAGSIHTLTWTPLANSNNVKILALRGDGIYPIIDGTPNSGSLNWTVGSTANPGIIMLPGTYTIQVKTIDGLSGITSNSFSVTGGMSPAPVITSLAPSSGSTKTQVTISGSGFTPDGNILNFGSNRFNSSFVNSSTLVFYAPDSVSGQYPVSVTNSNGTSNTLNFNFSSAGSSLSPTVTLVPDGPYVVPGGYTRLTWYATNASSCTAGGGWNDNAVLPGLSGRITVGPINSTTTFTITCTGAGPDVQASATVSVANGDRPTYSVTSPSGGEQWAASTFHTLAWNPLPNVGNVNIFAVPVNGSGAGGYLIGDSALNTGYFNWTIGSYITPGLYTIQVKAVGTNTGITSNSFSVTGGM